ncbi:MAG: peptidase [Pseudoruegeria sp.]
MTYCVGLMLNEGLVLLSDTRTNAGIDNIASYRKTFSFEAPGERAIVIMTAGSLSVTQTVISKLQEAIEDPDATPSTSIMEATGMLGVAEIVGNMLATVSSDIQNKMNSMQQSATASMIVAGQRKGGTPRMFLIYPEGNFIEATDDTPYIQIGEHKYGKPILDRVLSPETPLNEGRLVVLLSMDSTLRSNLSVGMPLDLTVIKTDDYKISEQQRIDEHDDEFRALSEEWSDALRDSFARIRNTMIED